MGQCLHLGCSRLLLQPQLCLAPGRVPRDWECLEMHRRAGRREVKQQLFGEQMGNGAGDGKEEMRTGMKLPVWRGQQKWEPRNCHLQLVAVVETRGQGGLMVWVAPSSAGEAVWSRDSAVSPLWALLPPAMRTGLASSP